jgi:hypothetical protein
MAGTKIYKMKKTVLYYLSFLIFSAFFAGCGNTTHTPKVSHVIVIGIDGMSVGGLIESETPNFDDYIKSGAHSFHVRNVMPTSSSPNWSAMLTGSGVVQTGITSNDWRYDNYKLPPVVTTENGRFPDIFYAIKKSNKSLITSSVYHWGGFANLYDHDFVDLDFSCSDERATAEKAAGVIMSEKPNFLFVQIDHVDGAGHKSGHMTEGYFKSIELADSLTGVIVDATKKAGIFDQTLFIIVSDHGGVGYDHGHETVQGNEVPFIMYGKMVKAGYTIPAAINLYDVAATSAYALNIAVPQVWVGRPAISAFSGAAEPENLVGRFMANSNTVPVILPRKPNGESGGLFVNGPAEVTMETKGTEGVIRFTTDGSIPSAKSELYTGPFKIERSGVIKAAYFINDGGISDYSEAYFRVIKEAHPETGVNYAVFYGDNWKELPDFAGLSPAKKGRTLELAIDEISGMILSNTAVVFEGNLTIKEDGRYTFYTASDDGSKLYINGTQVVDNDGDHGVEEKEGSVNLIAGKHKIRVEYLNAGGGFFLNCLIKGPGMPKQIISPEWLSSL